MTCFDHLMRFTDEPAAQADPVVGTYWTPASVDRPGQWRGDVCISDVKVYTVTGTTTDPTTAEVTETRSYFAGWFIVIALDHQDAGLQSVANGGCRLIADREAATAGKPNFIVYAASDVTPGDLAAAHVEPTFAGSRYPFGASP